MTDVNIGPASDFSDPGRRIVEIDGVEIGVFLSQGTFTAYENICPHLGGPVCQGKLLPRVREDVGADRTSRGMSFSKDQTNIVCPWHGYEYDIATGRHQGHDRLRLNPIKVRVEAGDVHVTVPKRPR